MFGKRAIGKAVLVVDVDDASVGVSVVEVQASAPAIVLASERMMLPLESRSTDQSASAIVQLLEQCADKVLKGYMAAGPGETKKPSHGASARAAPSAVHVILRAPWTRFRTAQSTESFSEPRAISKDIIPALAKKAIATITDLDASNILETGVMQVFLNGYPTGQPIGKRAQTIAVTAFESDVHATMKKGFTEVFGKLLPGRPLTFRSGMRALLTVLHEHVPDINRFVVVDLGGSATSIAVVRKEMVTQNAEATEGSATIIKRVAGAGLPEETLTQLRMLMSDTCTTDACKATKDALAKAEPELVKAYGDMIGKLAERRRLPNQCILAAPAELAPWLQGFFSRIDFGQFTATTQPLAVEALVPEHLKDVVGWKATTPPDTRVSIGAACVNILEHST
jgi:hypothetical protein